MRPRSYVPEYYLLEVSAGNTGVIEKCVIAMVSQVLEYGERPGKVGAAITDENALNRYVPYCCFPSGERTESERYQNRFYGCAMRTEANVIFRNIGRRLLRPGCRPETLPESPLGAVRSVVTARRAR